MSLRIGIGTNLRITPSLFSWQAYWTTRSNFFTTGRSGLELVDSYGNNPTITLPYFKSNNTGRYARYVDPSGLLDIGSNNEFTLCGWIKSESTSKTTYRSIVGKNVVGILAGRYGVLALITSGYLQATIVTSTTFYNIASTVDFTSCGEVFVRMDVNQTTKKFRFFINEVQVGADVDFLGTFTALPATSFFGFAIGNNTNANGTTNWAAQSSHADTYVFHKRLTPTEGATLMARGYVSGAFAHWTASNPLSTFLFENENGYHATITGDYTLTEAYSSFGSRYLLDKGYTLYSNGYSEYYLPLKYDGTENTEPTWPTTHIGTKRKWVRAGMISDHNLANSRLTFVGDQFDRSNATIYADTARGTKEKYDSTVPKSWHIEEVNNLSNYYWFEEGYQRTILSKMGDSTYYHREKLEHIFSFATELSVADYNKALTWCGDLRSDGIYEAEGVYWKYDTRCILFARDSKMLQWDSATNTISLSLDKGVTFPYSYAMGLAMIPQYSFIFNNGKIFFSSRTKLYVSNDNLATVSEATVLDEAGNPWTSAEGDEFNTYVQHKYHFNNDGHEMALTGTYNSEGATYNNTNVYVWELLDNSDTVKAIYHAGVTNPPNLQARHVHSIQYRAEDNSWWITFGDGNAGGHYENSWIKGERNDITGAWSFATLFTEDTGGTYKSSAMMFCDDSVVLVGDDNTIDATRFGIWSCPIADLADSANFVQRYRSKTVNVSGYVIDDDNAIFLPYGVEVYHRGVLITTKSQIAGLTPSRYYGSFYGFPIQVAWRPIAPNTDGWILCHPKLSTEGFYEIHQGGVMWIKLK
jgi:hypothetical protein